MKFRVFLVGILFSAQLPAQTIDTVYTGAYLRKSTSFAWTTFGGDLLTLSGGKADYQTTTGTKSNTTFGPVTIPRLSIGGIHFWGHADFYVSFPLPIRVGKRPQPFSEMMYRQGIETGIKLYPLKLQPGHLSPFLGASFRLSSYGHQTVGISYAHGYPESQRTIVPLQAGLTYTSKKYLFTAGLHYQSYQKQAYAISPTAFGTTTFHPLSVTVGVVRHIDTDRSMTTPQSADQLNKKHYLLKKNHRLSDWYVGLGPSAAMPRQLGRSSYIMQRYPYLRYEAMGGFMPDITVGRYFHQPDINLGLSYRTMVNRSAAFDASIRLRRHSFMLEGYKYLFNYLGFAPYIGPTLAVEQLSMDDTGIKYRQTKLAVGIIFGWDIRVTNTGTSVLRTNLRWSPNLHLSAAGQQVLFDNVEFNFIQYVWFLGRKGLYKKYRAKA